MPCCSCGKQNTDDEREKRSEREAGKKAPHLGVELLSLGLDNLRATVNRVGERTVTFCTASRRRGYALCLGPTDIVLMVRLALVLDEGARQRPAAGVATETARMERLAEC